MTQHDGKKDEARDLLENCRLALEACDGPADCCGETDNGRHTWPLKLELLHRVQEYLKLPHHVPSAEGRSGSYRDAVLEEAAALCEMLARQESYEAEMDMANGCAEAIRELKGGVVLSAMTRTGEG